MEDEDEFGDLYTVVLRPFSSSLSSASQPHQPSSAPSSIHGPIDLNLQKIRNNVDDDEILCGVSGRNPNNTAATSDQNISNSFPTNNNSADGSPRLFSSPDVNLPNTVSNTVDFTDFHSDKQDKDINFDIEDGNTGVLDDSAPLIPGLGVDAENSKRNGAELGSGGGLAGRAGDEDWEEDSDSEDDLQILLNDNNHGPMGIERGMLGDVGDDDDDDDEDGDPLVIVADGDPNQPMEEQDWGLGDDAAAAAGIEGERKEGSEAGGKGTAVAGPKIGYSNHGYHHPFHSQYKVSFVVVIC